VAAYGAGTSSSPHLLDGSAVSTPLTTSAGARGK
jgi:hypothetical protein